MRRGMRSYARLIENGDGVTLRSRGTCCVTPWAQGCLWNRDGHGCCLCKSTAPKKMINVPKSVHTPSGGDWDSPSLRLNTHILHVKTPSFPWDLWLQRRRPSVPFALPEFALEGADFAAQSVCGLRGLVQLPLQLPAGGRGPLGFLL